MTIAGLSAHEAYSRRDYPLHRNVLARPKRKVKFAHAFHDVVGNYTAAACTLAADSDWHAGVDGATLTGQSIKQTTDGSGSEAKLTYTLGGPVDLTDCVLRIVFKVGATDAGDISNLKLYLWDSGGNNREWSFQSAVYAGLWVLESLHVDDNSGASGVLDLTDVTIFRLQWSTAAGKASNISWGLLEFVEPLTTPRFMVTFDDCLLSQYRAGLYLGQLGIPGTFYCPSSYIGFNDALYLNFDQLDQLQYQGHLIANHSVSHANYDTETQEEFAAIIQEAAEDLIQQGFPEGAYHFAAPGGAITNESRFDFRWLRQTVQTWRGISSSTNRFYHPPGTQYLYAKSPADWPSAETYIDTAIARKQTAILYGHEVTNWAAFKAFADYLAGKQDNGDIVCITPADYINLTW